MKIRNRVALAITKGYAHGVWKPILFACIVFAISLGGVWAVDIFTDAGVPIGRLTELMLDPGAFDANAKPAAGFQFGVAMLGAIVFTSLTITTVSNIFSNLAESYRNGESSLRLRNHIVIIGTNQIFYNSLKSILAQNGTKVILTSLPAKEVRSKISAHLGSDKANKFTIVTGDRRLLSNLERVSYNNAKMVYILGEDNEKDHDAANISCLNNLCDAKKKNTVKCMLEIDSPEVLLLFSQTKLKTDNIEIRCFNPDELIAYELMFGDNPNRLDLEYLEMEDERRHHLIIIGSSSLSTEIAKLFLLVAHYPNFETKGIRSKLTIIDNNDVLNLGLQSNLKEVCHTYEYGTKTISDDSFDEYYYHDILDFEIHHIKGNMLDNHVYNVLDKLYNEEDITHIVISSNDTDENFKDSISLPSYFYTDDCPVFVYQPASAEIINADKLPDYYDNLHQFGLSVSLEGKYNELSRLANRAVACANLVFNANAIDPNDITDDQLDRERTTIDMERANIKNTIQLIYAIMKHPDKDIYDEIMVRCFHRNWVTWGLLFGISMMTKHLRDDFYYERPYSRDKTNEELRMYKNKYRVHYDMVSFDMLEAESKNYDMAFSKLTHDYFRSKL